MVKILKFVYTFIIFHFLILLGTNDGMKDLLPVINRYGHHITCITVADCPDHKCQDRFVLKCINNKCYYL
ncbi:unnamed protein product [Trifolium pratense]|uniref:Uncharacterized protein n=1 Tax=Trifolium pratense TaxID=57577 RepID=A0ACB0J5C2_TRIPR|nr:unnamed protein product [Trifolium pratense]